MAENLRAERVGECWGGLWCWSVAWVPAGGWVFGWFSTGRQGVSVGFRLVGGFFGRKSTGVEWERLSVGEADEGLAVGKIWCWAGGSLAVYRLCIRDGLLQIVAPDRRVCTSRIVCVYGKRIGTEQRSDVVSVSKNDGLRLYPKGNLLSPKLQKKTKR